jgi:hypothetical protein
MCEDSGRVSRGVTVWLLRLAVVAGFGLCAGCLLVPLPDRGVSSRVVDGSAVQFIRRGETTREEVLLRLGAPDAMLDGEDVFIYQSEYRTGWYLLMLPICAPAQPVFCLYRSKGMV